MAAPGADIDDLNASPIWALDDDNVANVSGAFNLKDLNQNIFLCMHE